jgi:hypothetical protein
MRQQQLWNADCDGIGHGTISEQGDTAMELTFPLRNGTRAGVMPRQGLEGLVIEQRCIEQSASTKNVQVIFHVPNKQVLDRIMQQFGSADC